MQENNKANRNIKINKRHDFEQAPGVGDGHGSPAFCRPRGPKESDTTEPLN